MWPLVMMGDGLCRSFGDTEAGFDESEATPELEDDEMLTMVSGFSLKEPFSIVIFVDRSISEVVGVFFGAGGVWSSLVPSLQVK